MTVTVSLSKSFVHFISILLSDPLKNIIIIYTRCLARCFIQLERKYTYNQATLNSEVAILLALPIPGDNTLCKVFR